MRKIPVGATVTHAYRFVFANALTVLKAVWLPLLAQLAVILLLTKRMALFLAAMQARDPSAATLFGPLLLLFPLVLVFFFAQFTAATEVAFGRPPQSWVAFHFDKPMWRLMGRFLAALLIIALTAYVGGVVLVLISYGLDLLLKSAPALRLLLLLVAVLLSAAYFCGVALLLMRFLFLLGPVSISEQRGLARAWTLSAGNFWRALLVTLAILIPVMVVNYAYIFSLAGLPPVMPNASKETKEAAEMAWRISELNLMAERWYFTLPLTGLLMLFQFGVGCAAQAFAYRVLMENEGSAPVAGDRLPD
jgi:hypothetical protein